MNFNKTRATLVPHLACLRNGRASITRIIKVMRVPMTIYTANETVVSTRFNLWSLAWRDQAVSRGLHVIKTPLPLRRTQTAYRERHVVRTTCAERRQIKGRQVLLSQDAASGALSHGLELPRLRPWKYFLSAPFPQAATRGTRFQQCSGIQRGRRRRAVASHYAGAASASRLIVYDATTQECSFTRTFTLK